MIATARTAIPKLSTRAWQAEFLELLPTIRRYAQVRFRGLPRDVQEDLIEEVVCNCWVAFVRLVQLGKGDLAYATALARYAVAQVRQGRRMGGRLRVQDVMSPYAQHRKGFRLERLDCFCSDSDQWIEVMVVDRRTPVPDQVAFRVDVPQWLATVSRRARKIATDLATGWTVRDVARKYHLSPGRISQIRRQLARSWHKFHGEAEGRTAVTA